MNDFLRWLDQGRGKQSSPSQNLISYANPKFGKRKKTEDGGQFDWQGMLLNDLPKTMGKNQTEKFSTLAKQIGVRPEEMRDFKTFIDAQEYGAKTHRQSVRDYDIKKAKSDGVNAKRVLEQRERNAQQAELDRIAELNKPKAADGLAGLFLGTPNPNTKRVGEQPKTIPVLEGIANSKFFQDLQKAFTGENYRIEPNEKRMQELEPSENVTRLPEGVERFGGRAMDSVTLGLLEQAERRGLKNSPDEKRQADYDRVFGEAESGGQKAADIIAELLGYAVPGVGLVKAARLAGVGAKGLTKSISKKNLKELAKEGTIVGGAMGATEVGVREALNPEDYSALDNLLHVGTNAAAGAVLDPLIGLAGPLAKYLSEQMAQGVLSKTVLKQLDDAVRSGDYESLSSLLRQNEYGPLPQPDLSVPKFSDSSVPEPKATQSMIDDLLSKGIEEPEPLSDDLINQLIARREQSAATMTMDEPNFQRQVEENFPTRAEKAPMTAKEMDEFTTVSYEPTVQTKPEKHDSAWRSFRRQFDSDTNDIKQIEREMVKNDTEGILRINNIGSVVSEDSLEKGVRGLQKTIARAEKSTRNTYEPILKRVDEAGIPKEDFDRYLSVMHYRDIVDNNMDLVKRRGDAYVELEQLDHLPETDARVQKLLKELDELEPYILPKGATDEWINYTINKWQSNPTMVQAQKDFVVAQQDALKIRMEAGLYSEAQIEAMIKRHPNYISMRRDIPDDATGVGSSRSVGRQDIMKRKDGSELKTLSPVDSAYRNHMLAVINAERAEVVNRIGKMVEVEGAEQYFRKVPESNENTLRGYENGQPVYYEVPKPLLNLYKNLDKQSEKSVAKAIQSLATLQKKLTTNLNIDFHLFSGVRDPIQALGNSRTQAHIGHTVLGYLDSFMGPNLEKLSGGMFKSYRDVYMNMGNERSTFISMDRHSLQKMSKALETGKMPDGSSVLNPIKAVEGFGMRVEHGPRLGEFRSAKRKGLSDADAAFEAADVIDYSDMGSWIREANKYVPYLNPTIRGNIRTFEALKNNPKQFFTTGIMYVTLPTIANYAMRYSDTTNDIQRDKINNLQPWQKNLLWAIPIPNTDKIAFMPKPFIFGQIFGNSVERTLDKVLGNTDKSAGQLLADTGLDLASVLSVPHDVAGLMTGFEIAANYDMFTQMPIESDAMRREEDVSQRYDSYTSEAAKALGKLTKGAGISPAQIDHILKDALGTIGRNTLDVSDNLLSEVSENVPSKVNPIQDILDPTKRFKHRDTQSSGVYNDIRKQKLQDDKAWNEHRDWLKDLGIKSPTKQESPAQVAYAEWTEINAEIREITNDKQLTAQDKKKRISALRNKQRTLGTKFIEN